MHSKTMLIQSVLPMTSMTWHGSEAELVNLLKGLDKTLTKYGMEISPGKTNLVRNSDTPINTSIAVSGQQIETINQFKYLGAISSQEGSNSSVSKAKTNLERHPTITVKSKMRLLACFPSFCMCASWMLTAELPRKSKLSK